MANTQALEQAEARVSRRVELSAPILEAAGISQEAYKRVVLNAFVLNPAIAECDLSSIDAAIMHSINLRLLPDGKDAAIVPMKGRATFIPMIAGQVKLAHQASRGLALRTRVVYKDDEWEYSEGLYPTLKHTPSPTGSRADADVIAVYAVARVNSSADAMYEVLLRGDIDRYRGYSASKSGPWSTHYAQMAEKTVLRRLLRRLPMPAGFGAADDTREVAAIELGDVPAPAIMPPAQDAYVEPEPEVPAADMVTMEVPREPAPPASPDAPF